MNAVYDEFKKDFFPGENVHVFFQDGEQFFGQIREKAKSVIELLHESSPSRLDTGCTADLCSCDSTCPSAGASKDAGGPSGEGEGVGDVPPAFIVGSAAGVTAGEAGEVTEAVWNGSGYDGEDLVPLVGPSSLHWHAAMGLLLAASESSSGDCRLEVDMRSSFPANAKLCAVRPVRIRAGVTSRNE